MVSVGTSTKRKGRGGRMSNKTAIRSRILVEAAAVCSVGPDEPAP